MKPLDEAQMKVVEMHAVKAIGVKLQDNAAPTETAVVLEEEEKAQSGVERMEPENTIESQTGKQKLLHLVLSASIFLIIAGAAFYFSPYKKK